MSNRFVQNSETVVAAASGSTAGLGKISTIPASGVNYFRIDCDRNVQKVDWQVQCNKSHSVQLYRARTNVTGGTITFTDATAVDDEDTFMLNGLTFTAEATEVEATPASRQFYLASQAGGAAALAVLLADATYGVPGIGAITVTAPATTDVLTIAAGSAPVYQFNQTAGSDAAEIAWAETTLSGLVAHGAAVTGVALNSTTAGTFYEQWCDGWPYCYLGLTNGDGGAAATVVVKATRYWA